MSEGVERANEWDGRILENEFEHVPVPHEKRKGLFSVSLIWIGFPMVITGALTGGAIVAALGFWRGLWAIAIGNLILFAYVALQSAIAAQTGMNFALIATQVFGKRGYRVVSGLLSTIVIGWFAVQTGLTGASLHSSLGTNAILVDVLAGTVFMVVAIIGTRALALIGALSVPFFLLMGGDAVKIALTHGSWKNVTTYTGNPHATAISVGVAITMVISLFVDSGTMTPDFTRWARSRRDAVIATFSAFPFANFLSMLFGALVVAAGVSQNGDFSLVIAQQGGIAIFFAASFMLLNSGSVCSHCLYNAAVGWSHIVGRKYRWMAFGLGLVGILAAAAGMWNVFIAWLSFLGVVVPGIGGTIIAYFMVHRKEAAGNPRIAFISWGIGALFALVVNLRVPELSTAAVGMAASLVSFVVLTRRSSERMIIRRLEETE